MKGLKWDFKTKRYELYELPPFAYAYEADWDRLIQCASCGKVMAPADGHASLDIRTPMGQEYAVCKECYEEEQSLEVEDACAQMEL